MATHLASCSCNGCWPSSSALDAPSPIHAEPNLGEFSSTGFGTASCPLLESRTHGDSIRSPEIQPRTPKTNRHVHRRQPSRTALRNSSQSQYQRSAQLASPRFELKRLNKRKSTTETTKAVGQSGGSGMGSSQNDEVNGSVNSPSASWHNNSISCHGVQLVIEPEVGSNDAPAFQEATQKNPDANDPHKDPLHHIPDRFLAFLASHFPGVSRVVVKVGEPEPYNTLCSLMDQVDLQTLEVSTVGDNDASIPRSFRRSQSGLVLGRL